MIKLKFKGDVVNYTDPYKLHGYGAICSKCFKEIDVPSGLKDWVMSSIRNLNPNEPIKLPCGHWAFPQDLDGSLIFIDEWIVSYISKMNRSGYLTTHCCSGHNTKLMTGYVAFLDTYDDLADYIIHHPRLLNIIDLEYWYVNKKDYVTTVYDREQKAYKVQTVHKVHKTADDHITIRLKQGYKFANSSRSRFGKLTLFRSCLNDIAKWCVKSKAYREKNKLRLGEVK